MARYDSEGYRQLPGIDKQPRRQILGYSRQVQGGSDEARARADQRRAEGWNPALRQASMRARRVAAAKEAGTFEATRDAYNEEGQRAGVEMDEAGTIRRSQPTVMDTPNTYVAPKRKVVREKPMSFARPASQRVEEIVESVSPTGLMDMARKARRRNTLVVK